LVLNERWEGLQAVSVRRSTSFFRRYGLIALQKVKDNAKEMSALLAQFRSGDLSSSAFCEQHQINKHTFRYWLYRTKSFTSI